MEYSYTIKDLQRKSGFSLPLLRKILNEIQPLMDDHYVKGEKNALMFNSNALVIIDQIKQMKNSGMNLPSIKREIEKSINTNKTVKTEGDTHKNKSINTEYFKEVLDEVKELYEKNIKAQSEIISGKDQIIKELNSRLLLITDGKPPEVVKAENEKKNQELIHLSYQIKEVNTENESLKTTNEKLKIELEEKLQLEKAKLLEQEKIIKEQQEIVKSFDEEKNKILSYKEQEMAEQKSRLFSLEEEKKLLQKTKEEELKKLEQEKNNKLLEQRKLIKEQEEKAKILEAEKKALEEQVKIKEEKKQAILNELESIEGKWFVGAKRKELLKQLKELG